ncbi:MAG: hypothetical protein U0941_13985 [Planctomycetaceae bacterium]
MRRRFAQRDTRSKEEKQPVRSENRDNREGPNGSRCQPGLNGVAKKGLNLVDDMRPKIQKYLVFPEEE